MLKEVLKIMFGMIFTQNYVLVQFIAARSWAFPRSLIPASA